MEQPTGHAAKPVRIRAGGLLWRVAPEHREAFCELMRRWDERGWASGVLLKDDHGSRVVMIGDWIVKESGPRRGRSRLRFGIRRSGSCRAFNLARRLLALGVATPEPMAWATERVMGLRVRDYLITRRIRAAETMASRCAGIAEDTEGRREIVRMLGVLLGSFHRSGFSNRDLKDENVLCATDGDFRMWAVDLDGVRRLSFMTLRRAWRDVWPIARSLGRIGWNTPEDAQAFLSGYNAMVPETMRLSKAPYFPGP